MRESKIAQDEKLDEPVDVAKDGYVAMMNGDDKGAYRRGWCSMHC